uniref:Uncharacterized protein n=1 Tax=Romanomermis culicivorax TaxID=13658 RepID=A0A915JUV2_ROMCU
MLDAKEDETMTSESQIMEYYNEEMIVEPNIKGKMERRATIDNYFT